MALGAGVAGGVAAPLGKSRGFAASQQVDKKEEKKSVGERPKFIEIFTSFLTLYNAGGAVASCKF